jgi:hypothetical protein
MRWALGRKATTFVPCMPHFLRKPQKPQNCHSQMKLHHPRQPEMYPDIDVEQKFQNARLRKARGWGRWQEVTRWHDGGSGTDHVFLVCGGPRNFLRIIGAFGPAQVVLTFWWPMRRSGHASQQHGCCKIIGAYQSTMGSAMRGSLL